MVALATLGLAQENHPAAGPGDARSLKQGNDYHIIVTNHSSSAMSAYAVLVVHANGKKVRHFFDARVQGRAPIRPGASLDETRPGVVLGARLIAAVYTDGATFGDAKQVADLMERRKAKLAALTRMESLLCDAQAKGTAVPSVIDSLEALSRDVRKEGIPMLSFIQSAEYQAIADKVKRTGADGPDAFKVAFESISASGAALMQDPITDPAGRPYIEEIPDHLACVPVLPAAPRPFSKPYSAHP